MDIKSALENQPAMAFLSQNYFDCSKINSIARELGGLENCSMSSTQNEMTLSEVNLNETNCKQNYSKEEIRTILDDYLSKNSEIDEATTVFVSAHVLYNELTIANEEENYLDYSSCLFGLSKVLNSQTRTAKSLIHPKPIDECGLIYQVDLKSYWGERVIKDDQNNWIQIPDSDFPRKLKDILTRRVNDRTYSDPVLTYDDVRYGSSHMAVEHLFSDHLKSGFISDNLMECTNFIHAMSRAPMYQYLTQTPKYLSQLFTQLGMEARFNSVDKFDLITFTDIENAITDVPRYTYCLETNEYVKSSYFSNFNTPDFMYLCVSGEDNSSRLAHPDGRNDEKRNRYGVYWFPEPTINKGLYLSNRKKELGYPYESGLGEIIYTLPNGLQGYMLSGSSGNRASHAPHQVVVDPNRITEADSNPVLAVGESCHGCHINGLNHSRNDVRLHYQKALNNPKFDEIWNKDKLGEILNSSDKIEAYLSDLNLNGKHNLENLFYMLDQGMVTHNDKPDPAMVLKMYSTEEQENAFYQAANQQFKGVIKELIGGIMPNLQSHNIDKLLSIDPILRMNRYSEQYYRFFNKDNQLHRDPLIFINFLFDDMIDCHINPGYRFFDFTGTIKEYSELKSFIKRQDSACY